MTFITQILDKWSCKHQWKVHDTTQVYDVHDDPNGVPRFRQQTLICTVCGKIKKITL